MRVRQTVCGIGDAEIAIVRVGAQAIRPEVFRSEMVDIEFLLWPRLQRFLGFAA